jgi:exopolysaccharide biosynthesis polyprenyl glycosylphosphotransferase
MFSKSKARRIWRTASLPFIDYLSLLFAGAIAYLFRYRWFDDAFTTAKRIYGADYLLYTALFALFLVIFFAFLGAYRIDTKSNSKFQSIFQLIIFNIIGWMVLIAVLFFIEPNLTILPEGIGVSRFILLTGVFFTGLFLFIGRLIASLCETFLYSKGVGQTGVVIIGDETENEDLIKHLNKDYSIKQHHFFKELNQEVVENVKKLIKNDDISEIYLCKTDFQTQGDFAKELAKVAERNKISFVFYPGSLGYFQAYGIKPFYINGVIYLELIHSALDGWQSVLKRLFDIVFSAVLLVLLSPIFGLIAIAIKLDSKGPVFYLSERVGPDGKVFKVWKFRRLKAELSTSENNKKALEIEAKLIEKNDIRGDGILYKIKDDPRATRVGKFLEKTSLDELPQFINVLLGNMSVVGPRPHQPREVAKYAEHHYKVLNIKPGITGLAQINGRSDLKFEDEVKYDTHYLENWNFWLDIFIVIKTPLVILFKKHKG